MDQVSSAEIKQAMETFLSGIVEILDEQADSPAAEAIKVESIHMFSQLILAFNAILEMRRNL